MDGVVEDAPLRDSRVVRILKFIYQGAIALTGLILLILPRFGMKIGAVVLGLWLLVEGVKNLITFFRAKVSIREKSQYMLLIRSVLMILGAVILVLRPGPVAQMGLSLIFFLAGLFFLVQGILLAMSKEGEHSYLVVILVIIGVVLMLSPLFTALWFLRLIGLLVMLRGALGIYLDMKFPISGSTPQ